jgi:hypothetical protein
MMELIKMFSFIQVPQINTIIKSSSSLDRLGLEMPPLLISLLPTLPYTGILNFQICLLIYNIKLMVFGLILMKLKTFNAMEYATKIKKQLTQFNGTFLIFQLEETWKLKLFL